MHHTIYKSELANMHHSYGGDLWNTSKLARIAFKKFPKAEYIQYSIGTGLWVDLFYGLKTGERVYGRIFERDEQLSIQECKTKGVSQ